jgi:enolase-phosphatase E1
MHKMPAHESNDLRAVLLDIEGTVTPISFVHDVLFPFARSHVSDYLIQHETASEVQEDIAALLRERSLDEGRGELASEPSDENRSLDAVVTYVNWLIDRDRKSPALKSLQGKIWEQGYRDGILKAPLFADVVPNLTRLRVQGLRIAIFSSGSVLAQKLLFAHTDTGDHTDLIEQYFDTAVGGKLSPQSYSEIAKRLELLSTQVVFVSDVTDELKAAGEAGMETLLCVRPGNQPQSASGQFQVIYSFSEILPTS